MKAYKIYINKKGQFDILEFGIPNPYDFSQDPPSNLEGQNNGHNTNREILENAISKYNRELSEGKRILFKCKECDNYVTLDEGAMHWYTVRQLSIPKRCDECIQKKKKRMGN